MEPGTYHMSVSRTFTLSWPQIAPFVEALTRATRRCSALDLRAAGLVQLANDTRTRFFVRSAPQPVVHLDRCGGDSMRMREELPTRSSLKLATAAAALHVAVSSEAPPHR